MANPGAPVVQLEPLDQTENEFEFARDPKRAAAGAYADHSGVRHSSRDRQLYKKHWDPRRHFAIHDTAGTVGTVAIDIHDDRIELGELHIVPGKPEDCIADSVLRGIKLRAELLGVPVYAICDEQHPVFATFTRHGFAPVENYNGSVALKHVPVSDDPNVLLA